MPLVKTFIVKIPSVKQLYSSLIGILPLKLNNFLLRAIPYERPQDFRFCFRQKIRYCTAMLCRNGGQPKMHPYHKFIVITDRLIKCLKKGDV